MPLGTPELMILKGFSDQGRTKCNAVTMFLIVHLIYYKRPTALRNLWRAVVVDESIVIVHEC